MVKITPRSLRRPHIAPDLTTRDGRARARRELVWQDHGFLRAAFANLHQISPEMYRANQPSPERVLQWAKQLGLKTILNLRGPSTKGYYLLEQEACEQAGIDLVDFQVFSRDTPTREAIFAADELFRTIRYPALMHCKSGADRAGLMAVLYKLLREEVAYTDAIEQLSGKYLHTRHGKTGLLDAFYEAYRDFNAGLPETQWKPFRAWVAEDYDRVAIKAAFLEAFGKRFQLDRLLGRE